MKMSALTVPVFEAFEEKSECGLCLLAAKAERKYVETYFSELVMDTPYRGKVIDTPFCNHHFYLFLKENDKLGTALTLESIVKSIFLQVRALKGGAGRDEFVDHNNLHKENPLDKTLARTRRLFGLRAVLSRRQHETLEGIAIKEESCPACESVFRATRSYCETTIQLLLKNPEFRAVFAGSDGLCLAHWFLLLDVASARFGEGTYEIIFDITAGPCVIGIKKILHQLQTFIRKFDYRFREEPWNGSENVVGRAVQKLVGIPGLRIRNNRERSKLLLNREAKPM